MSRSENEGVESNGTLSETVKECLIEEPSDTSGSAPIDPDTVYPRAREDSGAVTDEERQAAIDRWKI